MTTLCSINAGDRKGYTLKDETAKYFCSIAEEIIQASPNCLSLLNIDQGTALHEAVYHYNRWVVPILANIAGGTCQLFGVIPCGFSKHEEILTMRDNEGCTAFHIACDSYHNQDFEMIKTMLEHSPSALKVQTDIGYSPLAFLISSGLTCKSDKQGFLDTIKLVAQACPDAILLPLREKDVIEEVHGDSAFWGYNAKFKIAQVLKDVLVEHGMYDGQYESILTDRQRLMMNRPDVPKDVLGRMHFMLDETMKEVGLSRK